MRNNLRVAACVSASIFTFAAPALAGEGVLLKPRFKQGQVHYIEGSTEAKQSIKRPMGSMDMTITKRSGNLQKVESTSMDGLEISMAFERMCFSLDSSMLGELSYDSDIPSMEEAPNLKQVFEPMIGEKLIIKADRDHKVTDVTGVDELVSKIEKKNAGNPIAMGIRASLNEELISRQWRSIQVDLLPNKEVNIGDTWKYFPEEDVAQLGISVKFDCTCKLDRVGKQDGHTVAFVSFSGKPSEYTQRASMGGPVPTLEIKGGSLDGTFVFNLDEGRLLERNYTSDFTLASVPPKEAKGNEAAAAKPDTQVSLKSKNHVAFRTPEFRDKEKAANAKKAAEIKAKEKKEEADEEDGEEGDDGADE